MEAIDLRGLSTGKELNPFSRESDAVMAQDIFNFIVKNDSFSPVSINQLLFGNGEVKNESMDLYLSTKAISSSAVKEIIKTPLHYYIMAHNMLPKKSADYFDLGTFAHMAFLEPHLFEMVVVAPDVNLSTKDGVIKMCKFYCDLNRVGSAHSECDSIADLRKDLVQLKADCKYQIIQEEHKIIIDILKGNYYRYGNGIIPKLLRGAIAEVSCYAIDADTGLKVKVRPDAINTAENIGANVIISFKTTSAQNLGKFIYDTAKLQYELSEGMYQEVVTQATGRKFHTTIMIMLQTVPPYLPAVFIWDEEDICNGIYKYRHGLTTIKQCNDTGLWPGYDAMAEQGDGGIITLKQPAWASKELHPVDIQD